MTGLLRHELGHNLGLIHEHIFALGYEASDCNGDTEAAFRELDDYDANSVMHYPSNSTTQFPYSDCKGDAMRNNEVSAGDGRGARALYGPPVSWYVAIGAI